QDVVAVVVEVDHALGALRLHGEVRHADVAVVDEPGGAIADRAFDADDALPLQVRVGVVVHRAEAGDVLQLGLGITDAGADVRRHDAADFFKVVKAVDADIPGLGFSGGGNGLHALDAGV